MRGGDDVDHAATATRTDVEALPREKMDPFPVIGGFDSCRRLWSVERGADLRELAGALDVCEEAEMANASEAPGQHMQEKAADELVGIECHRFGFSASAIVFPTEANPRLITGEKPTIRAVSERIDSGWGFRIV